MSTALLWNELCDVIGWHKQRHHSCVDTLNRLWRKDPFVKNLNALPTLSKSALEVVEGTRSLDQLWGFIHKKRKTEQQPAATDLPVVLLRWKGEEYLIDGRRRINYWKRHENLGHTVSWWSMQEMKMTSNTSYMNSPQKQGT
jgi:hypothetical protein